MEEKAFKRSILTRIIGYYAIVFYSVYILACVSLLILMIIIWQPKFILILLLFLAFAFFLIAGSIWILYDFKVRNDLIKIYVFKKLVKEVVIEEIKEIKDLMGVGITYILVGEDSKVLFMTNNKTLVRYIEGFKIVNRQYVEQE